MAVRAQEPQAKQSTPGIKGQKATRVSAFAFDNAQSGSYAVASSASSVSGTSLTVARKGPPQRVAAPTEPSSTTLLARRVPSTSYGPDGGLSVLASPPAGKGTGAILPAADVDRLCSAFRKKTAVRVAVYPQAEEPGEGPSCSSASGVGGSASCCTGYGWRSPSFCGGVQRDAHVSRELRALTADGGKAGREFGVGGSSYVSTKSQARSTGAGVEPSRPGEASTAESPCVTASHPRSGAEPGPGPSPGQPSVTAALEEATGENVGGNTPGGGVHGQATASRPDSAPAQQLGRVIVFSPVKASRGAKDKLGSDVVLTPVRRSARTSSRPITPVSALLEATNFAYTPNKYLRD